MTNDSDSLPLLSRADLAKWLRRHAEICDLESALLQEKKDIEGRLSLVERLIGKSINEIMGAPSMGAQEDLLGEEAPKPPLPQKEDGDATWLDIVRDVLKAVGHGMSPAEVAEEIRGSVYADRLRENPNGHYNALNKLMGRNEITKVGELYYDPGVIQKYKDAGLEIPSVSSYQKKTPGRQSANENQIILVVSENPNGIAGVDIMRRLKTMENVTPAAKTNPNFIYNILKRLTEKEQIRKEGTLYFPISS